MVVRHARSDGVTARQERRTARGADFGGGVELREAQAFGGHLVEMRRLDGWVAVATQVAVTKVVGQDYDDVWTRRGGQAEGKDRKQGQQQG